jgi:hypothetical protein
LTNCRDILGTRSCTPGPRARVKKRGAFEGERRTLSLTNSAGILQLILLSPPLSQPDIEETLPTLQRWAFDTFGCSEISYE